MYQINMLNTLNLHSAICQTHFNFEKYTLRGKKERKPKLTIPKAATFCLYHLSPVQAHHSQTLTGNASVESAF